MRLALVVLAGAVLAACSSVPLREPAPPAPTTGPAAPPAPAPRRTRPPTPEEIAAIPDAVPREEPRSLRGNPPFYTVFGKRYEVLPTAEGYKERGVASWYGPTFHEKDTSTGEPYDMYAMTAAHKTLPLPAYARVTNLSNGRSVVVRINDRGPFVGSRIIDLSYTAAHKLDMVRAGTAFVEVEVITPASVSSLAQRVEAGQAIPQATAPALYVQAGAFGVAANAQRLAARLREAGFANTLVLPPGAGVALHRVRIGPISRVEEYDRIVDRLNALGIEARLAND